MLSAKSLGIEKSLIESVDGNFVDLGTVHGISFSILKVGKIGLIHITGNIDADVSDNSISVALPDEFKLAAYWRGYIYPYSSSENPDMFITNSDGTKLLITSIGGTIKANSYFEHTFAVAFLNGGGLLSRVISFLHSHRLGVLGC